MLAYELAFDPKGTFERPGFSISTTEHFFQKTSFTQNPIITIERGK